MLWHLPVVVELAVELGVLDEACVVQTVTTGATLHAVLVVGDVHYPQKESIVNGSATHATQRTQSGCCNRKNHRSINPTGRGPHPLSGHCDLTKVPSLIVYKSADESHLR
jgi:hypothetical protein